MSHFLHFPLHTNVLNLLTQHLETLTKDYVCLTNTYLINILLLSNCLSLLYLHSFVLFLLLVLSLVVSITSRFMKHSLIIPHFMICSSNTQSKVRVLGCVRLARLLFLMDVWGQRFSCGVQTRKPLAYTPKTCTQLGKLITRSLCSVSVNTFIPHLALKYPQLTGAHKSE